MKRKCEGCEGFRQPFLLISIHELLLRNLHNDTSSPFFFFGSLCKFIYSFRPETFSRKLFWGPVWGFDGTENYYKAVKVNWNDPQNLATRINCFQVSAAVFAACKDSIWIETKKLTSPVEISFSSSFFKGSTLIIHNRRIQLEKPARSFRLSYRYIEGFYLDWNWSELSLATTSQNSWEGGIKTSEHLFFYFFVIGS